jgi:hypothetical protein
MLQLLALPLDRLDTLDRQALQAALTQIGRSRRHDDLTT